MKDQKYISFLLKIWKGEAAKEEQEALDSWEKSSDTNKAFIDETKNAWDLTVDYKAGFEPDVDAGLSKLRAKIAAESPTTTKVVEMRPRRTFFKAAVAIALLLGLGFLLRNVLTSTDWQELRVAMGDTQEITLDDGTHIVLNEGSTLHYPQVFGKKRTVKLSGEAFFEVAKDAQRPFIIETTETEIKVLGTSFNVRAYTTEKITEVQVKTGKVSFSPKNNDVALTLGVNDKATFHNETRALIPSKDASLNAISWYSQQLSFEKAPLSKVITDLERYFKIEINLKNTNLETCEFTSIFNKPDEATMMQTLATAFDLRLKQLNPQTYELVGGRCD